MKAYDLFFKLAPSLKLILKMGYIPRQDDFIELNEDEYSAYMEDCGLTNEKVYKIPGGKLELEEVICLTESDKKNVELAIETINQYGKGRDFINDEERLTYVIEQLPEAFKKAVV